VPAVTVLCLVVRHPLAHTVQQQVVLRVLHLALILAGLDPVEILTTLVVVVLQVLATVAVELQTCSALAVILELQGLVVVVDILFFKVVQTTLIPMEAMVYLEAVV
jgi:hypothetical protein